MSMSLNDIDKIVRACLIAYIRGPADDKTLSYEALAKLGDPRGDLGLYHGGGPDRYTALSKALFHISSYEVEQGRPMLSALVVHKGGGQYKGLPSSLPVGSASPSLTATLPSRTSGTSRFRQPSSTGPSMRRPRRPMPSMPRS
jgi:hypothetical protein